MTSNNDSVISITTLISSEMVTAEPPLNDEQREALSEVDEWLTKPSHWLGFSLRFDSVLNIDLLKRGLSKTIHHIPALGARVVDGDSNNMLAQLVLTPKDQGVMLEYYKGIVNDEGIHLPNDEDTRQTWKQAGLDAPGPSKDGEESMGALMKARVVVFESQHVSYLSIGINHGLCDGSGICDILQVWSYFCINDATEGLPHLLSRRRTFGERVVKPQKPANNKRELYDRLESDVGCKKDPFSFMTFLFFVLPRAIWCMSRQEEIELRVSANRLLELKQAISTSEEWVSRFEVLCACVLLAEMVTSTTPPPSRHNLHVACNLRGRAERFPEDYFGNAAFDFCQPITNSPSTKMEWNIETVTEMTQKIHLAIRAGLADPENVCKTKDWFEAARHLGFKNKYDIWAPVVFDALSGEGTFFNKWDKRFMDVTMGSADKATAMVAYFGILQNLIIDVPRHSESGDSTIYLALPQAHAKRFQEFCRDNKEALPFNIVESNHD